MYAADDAKKEAAKIEEFKQKNIKHKAKGKTPGVNPFTGKTTPKEISDVIILMTKKQLHMAVNDVEILNLVNQTAALKQIEERLDAYKILAVKRRRMAVEHGGNIPRYSKAGDIWILEPRMAVNFRFYKDLGKDDDGEIDVYSDGRGMIALSALIDIFRVQAGDNADLSFELGLGVGTANINGDAENKTTAALLCTAGVRLDIYTTDREMYIGAIEAGYAHGYSFDESLDSTTNDDSAWYIGYAYKFSF